MKPSKIRTDTARGLISGLGVEDIAVKGGHDVSAVRNVVAAMRNEGVLHIIIGQSRSAMKKAAKK